MEDSICTRSHSFRAIKNMGIKPNYSELSRKFKMNRHAIRATYMRLDEPPKPPKQRPSVLDGLKGKIDERAEPPAEPLGVHSDKKDE